MFKILLHLVLVNMFVLAIFAQDETAKKDISEEELLKQQIREQRITDLQYNAKQLPVEISADILFRMLDANLIKDPIQKTEIIESLFSRATEAKIPYNATVRFGNVDTRPGYDTMTAQLELDRLNVRLKAVDRMLRIDKFRAREMFTSIPQVRLPQLKCEDALMPNIAPFYRTLGSVFSQTFNDEEKEQKADVFFAASYIDRISSPLELKPAAEMLIKLNVAKDDFGFLLHRYTNAMRRISPDPRSLATAVKTERLSETIKSGLYSRAISLQVSADELMNIYRDMLVSSLSERQCADALFVTEVRSDIPNEPPQKAIHDSVLTINATLARPITLAEIEPKETGSKADVYHFWMRPKSSKLLTDIKMLRFGSEGIQLTNEQRSDPEWYQKLVAFRRQMADWTSADEENESDHFHQKNVLYLGLIDIAPNDEIRSELLLEYGIFLRDSPIFKDFPAEWLKYAKQLLRPAKQLPESAKERFHDTLTSASSEFFPLLFELEDLINEES